MKAVYDATIKSRGWVSNIMKSFSIRPEILRAFQNFFATVMFGPSALTRAQRETTVRAPGRMSSGR